MSANKSFRVREPSNDEDTEMPGGKKPRLTPELSLMNTIESMMHGLSYLGGSSIELKLENLSVFLSSIMESHKTDILRILEACVLEHPGHVSAYATFVGLANVKRYSFGSDCIQFMVQKMLDYMEQCQWINARVILRFLVDLYNCNVVSGSSLMRLLTDFVADCKDPCEAGALENVLPQARRDWMAFCVLSALPSVGKELQRMAGFEKLMVTLQIHVKKRTSLHVPIQSVWSDDAGLPQLGQLETIWQQVKAMEETQWAEPELQLLPRPYLAFDERLSAALQHSLPPIEIPPHQEGCNYPQSEVIFRIFNFQLTARDQLKLPAALSIERYLLESQVLDVLQSQHLDRKKCAKLLISIVAAKPNLAVGHSIVEVILGEMLRLPKSAWPTINYGSILIELCRFQPTSMPSILAQAANILYSQLDSMNVACFDRLVNWLSFHLSNFGFLWQWQQWGEGCEDLTFYQPKAIFLRELLGKCIRLSYHRKIFTLLPTTLHPFLPPVPHTKFKYIDPLVPGGKLSEKLLDVMRDKRCEVAMISSLLKDESTIGKLRKISVFTQTCLHISSKSFSHTFGTLTKYLQVFKDLAQGESEQSVILEAVFEVWNLSQHYLLVVIEKMIRMEVLQPKVVVAFLFGPLMRKELTKMYFWELIHVTVRLVQNPQRLGPRKRQLVKDEPQDSLVTDVAIREILLDILLRIIKVLSAESEGLGKSDDQYRIQWVLGRMQDLLFRYQDEYRKLGSKLVKILEDGDLHKSIAKSLQAFLAYLP